MYARSERLKELYREEIAAALQGVKDPGLKGFLTITAVELSADKKHLNVFYSILGTEKDRTDAEHALHRAAPYLRQVLRKRVVVKFTPEIHFKYDDTPRKAAQIDKMLLKLEQEKRDQK